MNQLFQVIAEDIQTFAYCDDSKIDPDHAVAELERISASLRNLDDHMIQQFIDYVNQKASEEHALGNLDIAKQYKEMPEHLGLSEI